MTKYKNIKAKVYSDFLVGTAIAWFSSGIITPLFTKKFDVADLMFAMLGIAVSVVSLQIAVKYREETNANG
jgi:hypothetical protein